MKLKDTVDIHRSRENVWYFIEKPHSAIKWNSKAKGITLITPGSVGKGYQFEVEYGMSKTRVTQLAEVITYQPSELLVIQYTGRRFQPGQYVTKTFELKRIPKGTRLKHIIDITHSGIPRFWRCLMGFIHNFGKPIGPKQLLKLKKLVEQGA